jgi:hypothetical protein
MIIHADGTKVSMGNSLRSNKFTYCGGLRIDTDTVSQFWLDSNGGKRTIEANDYALLSGGLEFQSVFIYCASTSNVRLWASTSPLGIIQNSSSVGIASGSATGSKATSLTHTAVSVGTAATLILAANPQRKFFTLQNQDAADVFVGGSSTVTTANGTGLLTDVIYPDYDYTGDVYGIVAAGANDVRVLEAE